MFYQNKTYRICCLFYYWMAVKYCCQYHVLCEAQYRWILCHLQYRANTQHHWVLFLFYLRSCFLATPKKQAKDMFVQKRIWFTVAYLSSTLITIVLAATLP